MSARSSKCFFVVLLHLVAVAQWPNVLPFIIGLEEIDISDLSSYPEEPVWLQDVSDQLCLGPTGHFVECGDATLWQVGRFKRKRLRMGMFGIEDASIDGWRFQVVDEDQRRRKRRRVDCLRNVDGALSVVGCSSIFSLASSTWEIKGDGSLQSLRVMNTPLCLMRSNQTTSLSSCHDRRQRRVHLRFVRYRVVTIPRVAGVSTSSNFQFVPLTSIPEVGAGSPALHLPSNVDMAHASANADVLESSSSSRLLQPRQSRSDSATRKRPGVLSIKALHETNPILFLGAKSQTSSLLVSELTTDGVVGKAQRSSVTTALPSPRRMEVHPYIAASKNEIWIDPQTGLEYRTDLCRYLDCDRKAHGRVTLMGVGQYRKGYVVKVYGIAFYMSKRDALADPSLVPFAGLSAQELRSRPDFYHLMRTMDPSSVDRTLLLKTNMQLSAEVMRSSLHADWQYLTTEAKTTLINSSMREREADPEMLRIIQSPKNPSRCSCSQVAPEEYNADPSCCARGTELAFTWLKSGNLEVRLNGRLMDSFPRPDIAEGIFYEYLRYDDPISPELRERVVDGFPFLLAPLAQVKGVSIGHQRSANKEVQGVVAAIRAASGFAELVSTNVMEWATSAKSEAMHALSSAVFTARSMGETGVIFGKDLIGKKNDMIRQMYSITDTLFATFSSKGSPVEPVPAVAGSCDLLPIEVLHQRRESLGRAFGYPLSRWFSESYHAPDEIGPMKIYPTMSTTRKAFLAFVHFYLLLLFIVSFPGSYATRTKLVVRRAKLRMIIRDTSVSDSLTECSHDKTDSSMDSRGSPKVAGSEPSPGIAKRIKCRNRRMSKRGLLQRALGPSLSEDIQDELSAGSSNIRLKKKSLSYFL